MDKSVRDKVCITQKATVMNDERHGERMCVPSQHAKGKGASQRSTARASGLTLWEIKGFRTARKRSRLRTKNQPMAATSANCVTKLGQTKGREKQMVEG